MIHITFQVLPGKCLKNGLDNFTTGSYQLLLHPEIHSTPFVPRLYGPSYDQSSKDWPKALNLQLAWLTKKLRHLLLLLLLLKRSTNDNNANTDAFIYTHSRNIPVTILVLRTACTHFGTCGMYWCVGRKKKKAIISRQQEARRESDGEKKRHKQTKTHHLLHPSQVSFIC